MDNSEEIKSLREEIQEADYGILYYLWKRQLVSYKIAEYKKRNNLPIKNEFQESLVISRNQNTGRAYGLDRDFIKNLFDLVMKESCRKQEEVVNPKEL